MTISARLRATVVTLALLAWSGSARAQSPVITGTSGNVTNGQTLSISGNNFGTKSPAAPYKWDNFQNGTPPNLLVAGNPPWLFEAKTWGEGGAILLPAYQPAYSSAHPRFPGDVTVYHQFGPRPEGYIATNELALGSLSIGRLYIYAWFWSETTGKPARNAKVFQNAHGEWGSSYPHNTTRWDFYPISSSGHMTSDDCAPGAQNPTHNSWTNSSPDALGFADAAWHSVEFWHNRGGVGGNDAEFVTRRDGKFLNRLFGTFMNSNCPETWLGLMSYFDRCPESMPADPNQRTCGNDPSAYGPPYAALNWYWGEVYVDTTQARILICSASTWAAKETSGSHCEIQIPYSWDTGAIQFTVNQGTFSAGEQAYLYVVNSSGGGKRKRGISYFWRHKPHAHS